MIDVRVLRDDPQAIRAAQERRGESPAIVDQLLEADERRRSSIAAFEELRAEQKRLGKLIPNARGEEKQALLAQTKELAAKVKGAETRQNDAGTEFERYRARTVVVGNVGQLQGGIPLLPDAAIDDGKIDVVVIAPPRAWSWLRLVARVLTRRRRTDEKLDRLTGRKVVVRAERPTPRQLDGDAIGEGTEFVAEVQPGVLLIRVPS